VYPVGTFEFKVKIVNLAYQLFVMCLNVLIDIDWHIPTYSYQIPIHIQTLSLINRYDDLIFNYTFLFLFIIINYNLSTFIMKHINILQSFRQNKLSNIS